MKYRYFFNVNFVSDTGLHGLRNFQIELDSLIESLRDVEVAEDKIKQLACLQLVVVNNFILMKVVE